jgi:hypothetical protein
VDAALRQTQDPGNTRAMLVETAKQDIGGLDQNKRIQTPSRAFPISLDFPAQKCRQFLLQKISANCLDLKD